MDEIIYVWESMPALWAAMREDYCGCPDCHHPIGYGKTKAIAHSDLIEQEAEREEA